MNSNDRFEKLGQIFICYLGGLSFIISLKYSDLFYLPLMICLSLISVFHNPIAIFLGGTPFSWNKPKTIIKNEINLSIFIFRACLLWVVLNIVYVLGILLWFIIESIENGLIRSLVHISIMVLTFYLAVVKHDN
ncbi:MAG: hypothetical protein H9536_12355 [Aphanizomenon flos-aquae Clear-A1]|jgi:hypothetical protein|nr:hypothetical protein [Aphanizomenon flos-aquae Clear-A1]QSV67511.1 MAG: hypothetical protein HEQ12_11650 [Aphanizomenon flos-aquae DEX188]